MTFLPWMVNMHCCLSRMSYSTTRSKIGIKMMKTSFLCTHLDRLSSRIESIDERSPLQFEFRIGGACTQRNLQIGTQCNARPCMTSIVAARVWSLVEIPFQPFPNLTLKYINKSILQRRCRNANQV